MTHAGLFEGIGGFSLGAQLAEIETLWFSENDNYKKQILHQHFPKSKLYGKIENIQNAPYVDIITGGFPCTDISVAGNKVGIVGHRSSLWEQMYRVCQETRPRYIVIENSPQLLNSGLEFVLYDLSQIGYDAQWTTLRADWFGFRHKRSRLFIIAYPMRQRGQKRANEMFKQVSKTFQKTEISKQTNLPSLLKRFDRHSDQSTFRTNTGLSQGLDKAALHAIGDSVNVKVAHYIFECIKIFDNGMF